MFRNEEKDRDNGVIETLDWGSESHCVLRRKCCMSCSVFVSVP